MIKRWSRSGDSEARELDDLWSKSLKRIGLRMETVTTKFADLLKMSRQCQPMMASAAWIADYPDADNFMQLLSSANIGQSNYACYKSPDFDRMFVEGMFLRGGYAVRIRALTNSYAYDRSKVRIQRVLSSLTDLISSSVSRMYSPLETS